MKGLFLNIPKAVEEIHAFSEAIGTESTISRVCVGGHEVIAANNSADWPQGCLYQCPTQSLIVVAAGWLVFRGKMGNLDALATAIGTAVSKAQMDSVLAEIDAGAFTLFIARGNEYFVVTDPFGLHPHYCLDGSPLSGLAPSPQFLSRGCTPDPVRAKILTKLNHVIGNYTAYARIERLDPGSVYTGTAHHHYFDYTPHDIDEGEVVTALQDSLRLFDTRRRILPISGGLDSRLILACGQYDYGFTFGPHGTGDRPVARRFAGKFQDYIEFSLLDLHYDKNVKTVGLRMFDGICEKPFVELLAVYRFLSERWGADCLLFDGYIGDVFTRGTFLKYGGLAGSLEKMLPLTTQMRFDPLRMLRKRYAKLSEAEFGLLEDVFDAKIRGRNLSAPHKTLLFEILYGRASRYAINGGTILSRQFFTPIQPFVIPAVFRKVFGINPFEAMWYDTLPKLWRNVTDSSMQIMTYSGFKPMWNPHLSRLAVLITKGLGRVNVIKGAIQFDRELQQIQWR